MRQRREGGRRCELAANEHPAGCGTLLNAVWLRSSAPREFFEPVGYRSSVDRFLVPVIWGANLGFQDLLLQEVFARRRFISLYAETSVRFPPNTKLRTVIRACA
jgi:hypothetical protein